jgi:hypothetical protein
VGTAGTAGMTGLAGCNSINQDGESDPAETNTDEASETESDPNYSLQTSALEYDLTSLATSEANTHDQAYVENNYSAELGVTVLENGEELGLEKLGEVHLEDEEGERVETTDDGYVPEYAVEDGQELTVRAEIDGETKEETITVNKELPSEFYADARIQEGGEVLYDTDWSTPYSFDNHIVDRQAFLDQRAERRDELADDEIITEEDLATFEDALNERRDEFSRTEIVEAYLGALGFAMEGGGPYEGTGADDNAFNLEKAMKEHSPYENVFIGEFVNPKEPDVPQSTDGDGLRLNTHVAYVDGDWYHVGKFNGGARHISEIDEIRMAQNFDESSASEWAVSVLAEFERGNTDIDDPDSASYFVEEAVLSPVYAGDKPRTLDDMYAGELELGDDIAWETLGSVRDNEEWVETMVPLELAAGVTNETPITDIITASKDQEGFQIKVEKEE